MSARDLTQEDIANIHSLGTNRIPRLTWEDLDYIRNTAELDYEYNPNSDEYIVKVSGQIVRSLNAGREMKDVFQSACKKKGIRI